LIGFLGLSFLVQIAASGAASHGVGHWYLSLRRPPLTLPTDIFSVLWAVADLALGLAAWLVWRRVDPWRLSPRPALRLWGWQIALVALWPPVFFGLRAPAVALVVALLLAGVSVETFRAFWRRDRLAGALLLPPLAWLCYGAYLNIGFWWLNSTAG
jgi:tryptophan-rich sensory protein